MLHSDYGNGHQATITTLMMRRMVITSMILLSVLFSFVYFCVCFVLLTELFLLSLSEFIIKVIIPVHYDGPMLVVSGMDTGQVSHLSTYNGG